MHVLEVEFSLQTGALVAIATITVNVVEWVMKSQTALWHDGVHLSVTIFTAQP